MTARRVLGLVAMLAMSFLVGLSWVLTALGAFGTSERLDDWTERRILALLRWVERGDA